MSRCGRASRHPNTMGLMITASHNPAQYIGVKFTVPTVQAIGFDCGPLGGLAKVREIYHSPEQFPTVVAASCSSSSIRPMSTSPTRSRRPGVRTWRTRWADGCARCLSRLGGSRDLAGADRGRRSGAAIALGAERRLSNRFAESHEPRQDGCGDSRCRANRRRTSCWASMATAIESCLAIVAESLAPDSLPFRYCER